MAALFVSFTLHPAPSKLEGFRLPDFFEPLHYPCVLLPRDFFSYIVDTLRWIPTPSGKKIDDPLGLHIIDKSGARIASSIFSAWSTLFTNAPSELQLTGPFCFGNALYEGQYR